MGRRSPDMAKVLNMINFLSMHSQISEYVHIQQKKRKMNICSLTKNQILQKGYKNLAYIIVKQFFNLNVNMKKKHNLHIIYPKNHFVI